MMKQAIKNKLGKAFDLVISIRPSGSGGDAPEREGAIMNGEDEDDEQSKSDLAPEVKDSSEMGMEEMQPNAMMGKEIGNADETADDDEEIGMLERVGATTNNKSPPSLRSRAMNIAGERLKALKEKKLK